MAVIPTWNTNEAFLSFSSNSDTQCISINIHNYTFNSVDYIYYWCRVSKYISAKKMLWGPRWTHLQCRCYDVCGKKVPGSVTGDTIHFSARVALYVSQGDTIIVMIKIISGLHSDTLRNLDFCQE